MICVTNRTLCNGDFLERIGAIAAKHPAGIILREKDLSEMEYKVLAQQVMKICSFYEVPCILHRFVGAAIELHAEAIHLPLSRLRTLTVEEKAYFQRVGASCHSVEEALEAQHLGCSYITAGHIFETDCKKGLPGRGLAFLKAVCDAVDIPVYAIGGIDAERIDQVLAAGTVGFCLMSSLMKSDADSSELFSE